MAEVVLLSAMLPMVFEKAGLLLEHHLMKSWSGPDLKKQLRKLQQVLSIIQPVLQDAEVKQERDEHLGLWLSDLKEAAYDAEDLLDDIDFRFLRQQWMKGGQESKGPISTMKLKVNDFCSSSHNPLLFHARMFGRAKDINIRINQLAEERCKFNLRTSEDCPWQTIEYTRPITHSYFTELGVVGREADVERIIELLVAQKTRNDVSVLPIVGMGGLGKTTLLQMVYTHQKVKDHFKLRMWVSVPDDFSVDTIAKSMIENASSSRFELLGMNSVKQKLSQVMGGKRFLLALDDVWNEDPQKWEALMVLLTVGAHGSMVIVTTRSEKVSNIVRTLNAYKLGGLSNDECWTLFKRKAFVDGAEERSGLVEIGRLIIKKCDGLPLAAKTLGGLMRFKRDEREWKSVLESDVWDLPVERNRILPALRLSYHHMPPHLKQCFAFCIIFPRGHEIDKEELMELWMSNGFIPSYDTGIMSEFGGHAVFNDLAQRCFIQIINEKIRMHDLIRDLAKSIMGHECCILNKWEGESTRKFRHVIIDPYHTLPGSTNLLSSSDEIRATTPFGTSKTMRTLLSKVPCQSFNYPSTSHLRALCISKDYPFFGNYCISKFPMSICNLRHLRYLNLSSNGFETLPEDIGILFNLQTLRLNSCGKLRHLPKSITCMRSLMHLYLDGCSNLECMPSGMGELKCLRKITKYIIGSDAASGTITDLMHWNLHGTLELNRLENVRNASDAEEAGLGSKENLHALKLRWSLDSTRGTVDEEVLQVLRPHQNLRKLTIEGYNGEKLPTWLTEDSLSLNNLVSIELSSLLGCEHLPRLGHLPSLEMLEIERMDSVKHIGDSEFYGTTSSVVFPSLRRITLEHMGGLEEWIGVEGLLPSFPKVTEVRFDHCPKLKTMPAFPSAQILQIWDCSLLSPAKGDDSFFAWMRSLKKLFMHGACEKLIMLLQQENSFPSLEELGIHGCSGLEGFHREGLLRLTALKTLNVNWNHQLVALPELPESVGEVEILGCSRLVSLSESMGRLPMLESLCLIGLPMLSSLPEEEVEGYKSLQTLRISGCPEVLSLPVGLRRRIPSLRYLYIRDCPELERRCKAGGEYWDLISIYRQPSPNER